MAAYETALEQARAEVAMLRDERDALDRRILRLEQTIATLYRLTEGDNPQSFVNAGISDAIREALQSAPMPLSVSVLRSGMESLGYDFSAYENPSASIAGTLERMVRAGEAEKSRVKKNGMTVAGYTWAKEKPHTNRALVAINKITGDSHAAPEAIDMATPPTPARKELKK